MNQPFTLQEIERRRALLHEEKAKLEADMRADLTHLFAPMPSGGKVQTWMNNAERAIAVYDGVMLGFKLFRQFRWLFRRKKK